MTTFQWDEKKNIQLRRERGIGFEAIISAIGEGHVVDDFSHPNPKKYPNQRMMIVIIEAYTYLVPYIDNQGVFFLKTVIPSRKAKKKYIHIKKEAR